MIPPKGYKAEEYPLRHRLLYGCGLGIKADDLNSVFMPIVMHSTDKTVANDLIVVNPHNTNYQRDEGPLCTDMSIIDRLTISLKFQMTENCLPRRHTSGQSTAEVFTGDSINSFKFLWRPIFNVYSEKLDAADDDTGTTVAAILGLTKDSTNEDVVAVTTNNLPEIGPSELNHPVSTAHDIQVFGDFNMTTNLVMEDHVFDEDLLQDALKRYTNKGALRSCLGKTRHVTLSAQRPFSNFYIDKPVPRAIRRIQQYGFFGIQVHVPIETHVTQHFLTLPATDNVAHLGIKMIANYHEWHQDFRQESTGTGA